MNRQRVINIIREPLQMQHEKDLPLIKELIEEFPYFSTPYVLLTKLLSEQKSIYLDKYLKLSASYIGDREVLYNLIHAAPKQEAVLPSEANHNYQNTLTEEPAEIEAVIATEELNNVTAQISEEEKITHPESEVHQPEKQNLPLATELLNEKPVETENIQEAPLKVAQNAELEIQAADTDEDPEPAYIENKKNASEHKNAVTSEESGLNLSVIAEEKSEPETQELISEPEIKATDKENTSAQEDLPAEILKEQEKQEKDIAAEPEPKQEIPVTEEIKQPEPQKPALELPTLAAYDYFAFQEKKTKKTEKPEKQTVAEPVIANTDKVTQSPAVNATETIVEAKSAGKISFGKWLNNLAQNKPETTPVQHTISEPRPAESADAKPLAPERKPKRAEVEDIISKFIQTEPRIKPKPAKFFAPQDVAERSAEADTTLVTETLANIYLKQGLNDKAIEIFQQLMLKYPQKSNYFAVKIQEINTKAV